MLFGEYELSPGLIGLSLLPAAHPEAFQRLSVRPSIQRYLDFSLFNAYRFGPPSSVTWTSAWPRVDHLVSRLPKRTLGALFRLAFTAAARLMALNLARHGNS